MPATPGTVLYGPLMPRAIADSGAKARDNGLQLLDLATTQLQTAKAQLRSDQPWTSISPMVKASDSLLRARDLVDDVHVDALRHPLLQLDQLRHQGQTTQVGVGVFLAAKDAAYFATPKYDAKSMKAVDRGLREAQRGRRILEAAIASR